MCKWNYGERRNIRIIPVFFDTSYFLNREELRITLNRFGQFQLNSANLFIYTLMLLTDDFCSSQIQSWTLQQVPCVWSQTVAIKVYFANPLSCLLLFGIDMSRETCSICNDNDVDVNGHAQQIYLWNHWSWEQNKEKQGQINKETINVGLFRPVIKII